jgi:hypothetical protein
MKRMGWWVASGVGILWALLTFFASNSPSDVQQRTNGWLALPVLKELPDRLITFAGSTWVLAASFFTLGMVGGTKLVKWWLNRDSINWTNSLGLEMSLLAYDIENGIYSSDLHRLNADIDVVRVKATRHGLSFPKRSDGFVSIQSLLPYLTRVSAHLKAGHIDHARNSSHELSKKST